LTTIALSEIIAQASKIRAKKDKVNWLRQNSSDELRLLLSLTYDTEKYEFHLPDTVPPYKPSVITESHGLLYREMRKMKYFIKGYAGDSVQPIRREALFIQMLETVDPEDAKLLEHMIQRKPFKGLTAEAINEAFPDLDLPTKKTKKAS